MSLSSRILDSLYDSKKPLTAKELAVIHKIEETNVNDILSELSKTNNVKSDVYWYPFDINSIIHKEEQEVLSMLSKKLIPTLQISKALYGPKATAKNVNPLLYGLEKKGLIKKIAEANGAKPRWSLI